MRWRTRADRSRLCPDLDKPARYRVMRYRAFLRLFLPESCLNPCLNRPLALYDRSPYALNGV